MVDLNKYDYTVTGSQEQEIMPEELNDWKTEPQEHMQDSMDILHPEALDDHLEELAKQEQFETTEENP